MAEAESALRNGSSGDVTVIESPRTSLLHSIFAFALWIGSMHLFFTVFFASIFLLPLSKTILVFAFLIVLAYVPVDAESSLGLRVRRYIFENVTGYFPITVHVEDIKALRSHPTYVFVYEPHSVLPSAVISLIHLINILPLPKSKVLASSAAFKTPFMRHVWTWMGISPVTRKNFTSLLDAGYSCAVIPGGAREAELMVPGSETLFLKSRKGFIRTAMEFGVPLIPVFAFGQSKTYSWWRPSGKFFLHFRRIMKFSPMIFWGVWGTLLSYRVPIHVVVGKPIQVERNAKQTPEEVDKVHAQFLQALEDLFERHKTRLGYPDLKLEII